MTAAPRAQGLRRMLPLIAAAAVVVASATAVALVLGRARIKGDTPKDRIASICRLADDQPWGAADVIAEAAAGDADATVRETAMIALGRFVSPKCRSTVEAGTRDSSPLVRAAAAATLALYKDDDAARRIAEMLAQDGDGQVRQAAAEAMNQLGTSLSLVLLVEAAEKDKDPEVQARAAELLLSRFNKSFAGYRPQDAGRWRELVQYIKESPAVQEAFKSVNRPLELHPEHRITFPDH